MAEFIMNTTNMPDHVLEVLRIWYINNEQIVRCRDCDHFNDEEAYGDCDGFCDEHCGGAMSDDFCSWAVRRNDD